MSVRISEPGRKARKKVSVLEAYQRCFAGEHGHKVLLDLMRTHFVTSSTFSKDPLEMAHNEGERNVVLRILYHMKIDTNALLKELDRAEKEAKA